MQSAHINHLIDPSCADPHPQPDDLLAWYDQHGRDLPWRLKGGRRPDPYHVWLSEIMLQQTTVAAVKPYFAAFLEAFPTVQALAAADDGLVMEMWAGLGYYARARNLLKCARVVTETYGGQFPQTASALKELPGIGDYTSAAIAAIAFNEPAAVVDGNIERVTSRLYTIETPLPAAKVEIKAKVEALTPQDRPGDFAQAMMDLGATLCTPKAPKCLICCWREACAAHAIGIEERFPIKPQKKPKPVRYGTVFWIERNGQAFLIRRPERGLLGGMLALVSTDWDAEAPVPAAPCSAEWQVLPNEVKHVFTHFELRLSVWVARVDKAPPLQGEWRKMDTQLLSALPTVMKKAAKLAMTR
ncbi:MAG: A/G-specific adenine glycosylase [Pseudomonadota bacterium]